MIIFEIAERKPPSSQANVWDSSVDYMRRVRLFVTLWTAARQAPLSMAFSRQQYWSALPFSPLGDLLTKEDPVSPASPALAGGFSTTSATWGSLGFPKDSFYRLGLVFFFGLCISHTFLFLLMSYNVFCC